MRTAIFILLLGMQLNIHSLQAEPHRLLNLTIVPTDNNKTDSYMELYGRGVFYIVLRNRSSKGIRIWKESNSWGYFNITLEIEDSKGNKIVVKKKPRAWNKNYPGVYLLAPNGYYIFKVALLGGLWNSASTVLPKQGENNKLKISAIFNIPATENSKSLGVWTGKISSPNRVFQVYR